MPMRRLLLALVLAGTAAAAQPPPPRPDTLAGTVVVPGGLSMPRGARVEVALLDLDGLERLGSASLSIAGLSGEVPFALGYDARDVRARVRYALAAEVRDGDYRLIYASAPEYVPVRVDRRGRLRAPVQIALAPAAPGPAVSVAAPSPAGETLTRETWHLTEVTLPGAPARPVGSGERYALVFRGSGVYSGEAGCARFFGRYEASASGGLTLGPATVTRAGCPVGRAPADPVPGVLAGTQRVGRDGRLVLSGPAGRLSFAPDARPRPAMARPDVDRLSEYACGDAGTFRLRTGRGDAEVWLSDALAARATGGPPPGIYHVLGQVPAAVHDSEARARYAYGPLAAVVDGAGVQGDAATLEVGAERLRCTRAPGPAYPDGLPALRAESGDWTVQIYGTPPGPAVLEVHDGVAVSADAAVARTLAPGVTEYRARYGRVATVTAGACADGRDRVRLVRPEGTSDGCRVPIE